MLYLDENHIDKLGIDWNETVNTLEEAVKSLSEGDFSQPIKPYVKFQNPKNRIIAMPAFVGGNIDYSGIKWIASFPDNIGKSIPRAHSVTILNDSDTGKPVSIINTAKVSGIRTASVSGLVIKKYLENKEKSEIFDVGILGFGPIGQLHLKMVSALLKDKINKIRIFDIRPIEENLLADLPKDLNIEVCTSWEDVYTNSNIFITCTVSSKGYINKKPRDGALLLNVSLRDFTPDILNYTRSIVVDDWEEVNRESTDIYEMSTTRGLKREETKSIVEVVCSDALRHFSREEAIMFNPMGMAVFDIAIAAHYYNIALIEGVGINLQNEESVSNEEDNRIYR